MPYVKQEERERFGDLIKDLSNRIDNAGQLNFVITSLCHFYLAQKGVKYVNINEVIGCLECAKLESYRKVAAGYEDKKEAENGPIAILE